MTQDKNDNIRQQVIKTYKEIAKSNSSGCGCTSSCCGPQTLIEEGFSERLGYSKEEIAGVPSGANMGLGCGNPQAIADLKQGETIVDLGCGGGFDCFLAAKQVGDKGLVIGVDMTSEMISKARNNLQKTDHTNVEFRLGEIEHLPVADNSVDVIISNCVINLSPEKTKVFLDAYRVLKKGGRLAISDIVAIAEIPDSIKNDIEKYTGCIAGAAIISDIENDLKSVGFKNIKVNINEESRKFIEDWFPNTGVDDFVASATIEAIK